MDLLPDDLEVLAEAADFYYEAACLYEDVDLDPEDHVEVVRRAFLSSDCDAFAQALSDMTGWPLRVVTWSVPVFGFGHHTVCVLPDGAFVDVAGRLTLEDMAERYGVEAGRLMVGPEGARCSPASISTRKVAIASSGLSGSPFGSFLVHIRTRGPEAWVYAIQSIFAVMTFTT